MKKTLIPFLLAFCISVPTLGMGVDSDKVMYVGGTAASLEEMTEGRIVPRTTKVFIFASRDGKLSIPYARITSMEYGREAGKRAIITSPLSVFSKKKKHYLTIGYLDEDDKQQTAVFELGKDTVRGTLATLEAKTGRKVERPDNEPRKDQDADED